MDKTRACYTEWSKSEREKQIYWHIHGIKKIILMNLLQRRNGDTDVENQLVDTVGEGMGRMEKVSSTCIHYQM